MRMTEGGRSWGNMCFGGFESGGEREEGNFRGLGLIVIRLNTGSHRLEKTHLDPS
jgi:hypothetical protein